MTRLLITCEHASNKVPREFASLFRGHQKLLATHRGWDIGAFPIYEALWRQYKCQHLHGEWTRLLCDLNRTAKHKSLHWDPVKALPEDAREVLLAQYYHPYWSQVFGIIAANSKKGHKTLHLSIHSFTPILHGETRNADLGLLYDPKRAEERKFAERLKGAISDIDRKIKIRKNYPYLGNMDGLTCALRKSFGAKDYLGMEIEFNQKHFIKRNPAPLVNAFLAGFAASTIG